MYLFLEICDGHSAIAIYEALRLTAHLEMFDKIRPASMLLQVTPRLRPRRKVEIEADSPTHLEKF